MANFKDILKKKELSKKTRALEVSPVEKKSVTNKKRKRKKSSAPTRPWQDLMPEYSNNTKVEKNVANVDIKLEATESSLREVISSLPLDIAKTKMSNPRGKGKNESAMSQQTTSNISDENLIKELRADKLPAMSQQTTSNESAEKNNTVSKLPAMSQQTTSNISDENLIKELRVDKLPAMSQQTTSNESAQLPAKLPAVSQQINLNSFNFHLLSGSEFLAMTALIKICKEKGTRITGPIKLINFSDNNLFNYNTLRKSTIPRLKKKGLLSQHQFKSGRNGWVSYEVPQEVLNSHSEYMFLNTRVSQQTTSNESAQTPAQLPAFTSSSSNVLNLKNTTTKAKSKSDLPEEWQNIDLSNLDEIGFREGQLLQVYNAGTELEIVSESLEALRHDITRKKIPSSMINPLGIVMKCLRVDKVHYNSYDKGYVSEVDKALKQMEKIKLERALEIQELREKRRSVELDNWKHSLSRENLKRITGSDKLNGGIVQDTKLSLYFETNILEND